MTNLLDSLTREYVVSHHAVIDGEQFLATVTREDEITWRLETYFGATADGWSRSLDTLWLRTADEANAYVLRAMEHFATNH